MVGAHRADGAARKAESLGGAVLAGAFEVFNAGRMAAIRDPADETFPVWQAGEHIGARLANIPGTLCWNELYSSDTERAAEFYGNLFGWTAQKQDMEGAAYMVYAVIELTNAWGSVAFPPAERGLAANH